MPAMLRILQRILALSDGDDIFILLQEYLCGVVLALRLLIFQRVDVLREVGLHSFRRMVEEVTAGLVELYRFFGRAFPEFYVKPFQQAIVLRVLEIMVDPAHQLPFVQHFLLLLLQLKTQLTHTDLQHLYLLEIALLGRPLLVYLDDLPVPVLVQLLHLHVLLLESLQLGLELGYCIVFFVSVSLQALGESEWGRWFEDHWFCLGLCCRYLSSVLFYYPRLLYFQLFIISLLFPFRKYFQFGGSR